ncbi:MAG: ATP-binding protein [Candidatus Gastranaerophilales bacterium]|nr:ATP-binding protein [Candidatus Gastranaerophilales bacterium]
MSDETLLKNKKIKINFNQLELNNFINNSYEQKEKERIVKWIINALRENLSIKGTLDNICKEIGVLLNVDRCSIAIFNFNKKQFEIHSEHIKHEKIPRLSEEFQIIKMHELWDDIVQKEKQSIVINNFDRCNQEIKKYCAKDLKSLILTPIIGTKKKIYGLILNEELTNERQWKHYHIESLEYISSIIGINIRQNYLNKKLKKTNTLKSTFLANMTHEFRTPLNAIIGFADLLSSVDCNNLTGKQKHYLKNISYSANHLLRLINDVLELSKINAGIIEANFETFNSQEIIQETVDSLQSLALEKQITLKISIVNAKIFSDAQFFRQILYNLINNAIKFTNPKGKVIVRSKIIKNNLKIEVEDNGIGIAKKHFHKVFKQFVQIDSGYSRTQEGTGLGLALTQKLAEIIEGDIGFTSKLNKGSTFWVTIPKIIREET